MHQLFGKVFGKVMKVKNPVCLFMSRVREAIERLHEHMRKDIKTNARCQSTRLTRPVREEVISNNVVFLKVLKYIYKLI